MAGGNEGSVYDLKSVKLPYLSGFSLKAFVTLLEGPLRSLIMPSLFESAGLNWLRERNYTEQPTNYPSSYNRAGTDAGSRAPAADYPKAATAGAKGFRFASSFDYAAAYRSGRTTPLDVAGRFLEEVKRIDGLVPPLKAFVAIDPDDLLRQAELSAKRWKAGKPLGPLDGVPVAVKDELDMAPYPTTVGTSFLGDRPAVSDATAVKRIRDAGALMAGKTAMHEIGIGVTGLNIVQGTPRNPYNTAHYTGGSSSGPASAVGAGLAPIAIGADGGGSIRIPAAFCGVFGLKPTFGRVSEHGAAPLCWSVAHVGPLASTAADLALAYAVMAGPDAVDPMSKNQPPPSVKGWDAEIRGLRLGVFRPWFEHASPDVVAACEEMLKRLIGAGAVLREVTIPGLEEARIAHTVTIASEMARSLEAHYAKHRTEFNPDVRINLALAREFTALDYLQAQRVRTRITATLQNVLGEVDVIVTPSSAVTAPKIKEKALKTGESDITTLMEIMRFATPANLTGLPAISFVAGYDGAGLPVGMQALGRPWDEALLLRIANAAERELERKKPAVYAELLA